MPRLYLYVGLVVVLGVGLWLLTISSCSVTDSSQDSASAIDQVQTPAESNRDAHTFAKAMAIAEPKGEKLQGQGGTNAAETVGDGRNGESDSQKSDGLGEFSSNESGSGAAGAYASATELASSAAEAANDGDYSKAFVNARNAWVLVSRHPVDSQCKQLAEELLNQMRIYGERANRSKDTDSNDKLLIVQ
jgi:hypothetical protein